MQNVERARLASEAADAYVRQQMRLGGSVRAPRVTKQCGSINPAAHYLVYLTRDELSFVLASQAADPTGVNGPQGLLCAPPVQVQVLRVGWDGEPDKISIAPNDTVGNFVDAVKSVMGQGGSFLLHKEVEDPEPAVVLNPDAAPLGDTLPAGTTVIDDLYAPMAQFGGSNWVLQPYDPEPLHPMRIVLVTLVPSPDAWDTEPEVFRALGDLQAPLFASDDWDGMIMVEFSLENTGAEEMQYLFDMNDAAKPWHYRDRHGNLIKLDNDSDFFDEEHWTTSVPRRCITLPP